MTAPVSRRAFIATAGAALAGAAAARTHPVTLQAPHLVFDMPPMSVLTVILESSA